MIYTYISICTLLLYLIVARALKLFSIGKEYESHELRKIHTGEVTRLGGIIFFSGIILLYFIEEKNIKDLLIFSYLFLIIGLIEDIKKNISSIIRITILLFAISFTIYIQQLTINSFDNYLLNFLFNNFFLSSLIFSIFGLLILINGFNFIDGLNGLLLGISSLILITFSFYSYNQLNELYLLTTGIAAISLIFFYFNFLYGRILSGDGGSYFLGTLIASISIFICNQGILSASAVACVIFYPAMEGMLTVFRRLVLNASNPMKPDNLHLHQFVFFTLRNAKFTSKLSQNHINSLSSFVIILSVFIMIVARDRLSLVLSDFIIFLVFCSIYLLIYLFLFNHIRKLSKNNF